MYSTLTQYYMIPITPEQKAKAQPGQFVYNEHDEDEIVGFVETVDDTHVKVMLFQPQEIPFDTPVISISNYCDWQNRLTEIMDEDESMQEMWALACELHQDADQRITH